jgi:beta-lactamase superfamily II metal-dependent hydrolase
MEIKIFDVAHGFCAYIIAENRNVILVDCGCNPQTGFSPSSYLSRTGCSGIERLFITNYDEDHLDDLPNLRHTLSINVLHRNRSLSGEELRQLKLGTGPLQPGMRALLEMIETFTTDVSGFEEFPDIEIAVFWNSYPSFEDTNNLSLVTFLHFQGIHLIFSGDLEKAGWRALLQRNTFREHLGRVNLYIASHHGRESGYCEDVFDYCHPDIVIISDESKKFETQKVDYKQHASGISWQDGSTRYVLTTRNDGMITISNPTRYSYYVHTSR